MASTVYRMVELRCWWEHGNRKLKYGEEKSLNIVVERKAFIQVELVQKKNEQIKKTALLHSIPT